MHQFMCDIGIVHSPGIHLQAGCHRIADPVTDETRYGDQCRMSPLSAVLESFVDRSDVFDCEAGCYIGEISPDRLERRAIERGHDIVRTRPFRSLEGNSVIGFETRLSRQILDLELSRDVR